MKTIETNYSPRPATSFATRQAAQPAPGGNPAPAARDADEPAAKIGRSVAYMMRHLDKSLQVATLAALANVSPSHYFALFKRLTGHAPIDFFIHLRMHRACELLDSPWLRVKEVAAALGYDDPFYFSRIFKSVNRVAPSQYQAMPQEFRDAVKQMTFSFIAVSFEARQALQTAPDDSSRFVGAPEPRQKTLMPMPPASEPPQGRDWKDGTLRSTPKAFCYAG